MKRKHAGTSHSSSKKRRVVRRRVVTRKRTTRRRRSRLVGSRAAKLLGYKPGKQSCKQAETVASADEMATRDLAEQELFFLSHGDNPAQRLTNRVNLRGLKIMAEVRNLSDRGHWIHMAVLSPRDSDTISTTGFFRSYGDSEGQDFDATLTNLELNTLPINTSKYLVLKKFKFYLAGGTETSGFEDVGTEMSVKSINWYQKINRQMRFASTSSTLPESGRIYLVWWCATPGIVTTEQVTGVIRFSRRVICAFREPR